MNPIVESAKQRQQKLLELYQCYLRGEIKRGDILRQLRRQILGMNQDEFCKIAQISRRSLTAIENNEYEASEEVLNRAFGIFGLKTGLVLVSDQQMISVLEGDT